MDRRAGAFAPSIWGMSVQPSAFEKEGFAKAVEALRDLGIPFEGPDDTGVAGPSVFFRDPDGHELEITAYEPNRQG